MELLDHHMFTLVMLYVIFFTNHCGVFTLRCALSSTVGRNSNDTQITVTICEQVVEHCMIMLSRTSANDPFEYFSLNCWPWNDINKHCPEVEGICQIVHITSDGLLGTCCCRGDMCNNYTQTLNFSNRKIDISDAEWDNLNSFGVDSGDRVKNIKGFQNSEITVNGNFDNERKKSQRNTFSVIITLIVLALTFSIVGILILCLSPKYEHIRQKFHSAYGRSCASPKYLQGSLTSRSQTSLELSYLCCSHRNWPLTQSYEECIHSHVCSVPDMEGGRRVGLVDSNTLHGSCSSSTRSDLVSFEFSETRSVNSSMQLISKLCHKEKLLGRGRFAEVWLAHVSINTLNNVLKVSNEVAEIFDPNYLLETSPRIQNHIINSAFGIRTNDRKSSDRDSSESYLLESEEVDSHDRPNSSIHCNKLNSKPFRNFSIFFQRKFSYAQSSLPSSLSPPLTLLPTNQSTSHSNPRHLETDDQFPVAVKIFPPSEVNAWKTELGIFKIIRATNHWLMTFKNSAYALPHPPSFPVPSSSSSSSTSSSSSSSSYSSQIRKYLSSSNLVSLLGAGSIQSTEPLAKNISPVEYRLVMEFASGGSLRSRLSDGSWIPLSVILSLCSDITHGLAFLHSEFVVRQPGYPTSYTKYPIAHRDLKPENILLRSNGTACLSDFGQAVCLTESIPSGLHSEKSCQGSLQDGLTTAYSINSILESMPKAGTLRYQAPEILDGAITFSGPALLRTDIYSLGLVLWELLTAVHLIRDFSSSLQSDSNEKNNISNRPEQSDLINQSEAVQCDNAFKPESIGSISANKINQSHEQQRHHWLPYEKELGIYCNSSLSLQQLVSVKKCRPASHPAWYQSNILKQFYRTITECWDPDPEARLTVDCVLERIRQYQSQLSRLNSKN